jgi:hypothetical protein
MLRRGVRKDRRGERIDTWICGAGVFQHREHRVHREAEERRAVGRRGEGENGLELSKAMVV